MDTNYPSSTRALKRAACDRCHDTKSRCSRSSGSGNCERCKRLDLVCTYSAPLNMGRPRGKGINNSSRRNSTRPKSASQERAAPQCKRNGGRTISTTWQEKPQSDINNGQSKQKVNLFGTASKENSEHRVASNAFGTSDPIEDTMYQNELSLDWLGACHQPLMWPTTELESMLSYINDVSIPFLNDPLTDSTMGQSIHGSDVADPTADAANKAGQLEHPMYSTPSQIIDAVFKAPSALSDNPKHKHDWTRPTSGSFAAPFISAEGSHSNHTSPSRADQYERCLDQLSKLHLDLHRLLRSSPQKGVQDRSPSNVVDLAGIDATLVATQTLINIIQHLFIESPPVGLQISSSEISRSPRATSPQQDLFFHYPEDLACGNSPTLSASTEVSATSQDNHPDTITILLILTCYLRLLHIYEPFVVSLHQRLQQSTNTPTRSPASRLVSDGVSETIQNLDSYLPSFSFGSFNIASSSDLNIKLLLHLISQMLESIHGAMRVYFQPGSSNRPGSAGHMGEGAFENSKVGFEGLGIEKFAWLQSPMAFAAEAALSEVREKETSMMRMLNVSKNISSGS